MFVVVEVSSGSTPLTKVSHKAKANGNMGVSLRGRGVFLLNEHPFTKGWCFPSLYKFSIIQSGFLLVPGLDQPISVPKGST